MHEYQFLSLLFVLFFSPTVDSEGGFSNADAYAAFKNEPAYIADPTPARKEYYDAYNKTLDHWGADYEELYVPTSKGMAHVITSGPKDGVPVILMHGMAASSTMWYPNAKPLSRQYRLFAIDLIIEPGKSYITEEFKNLHQIAEWYQEICDQLNLDSYHIIGTSRGGWLATDLAMKSDKTRSLILLSPVQTLMWMPPSMGLAKNMFNIFYSKEKRAKRTMETLSNDPSKLEKDYVDQYHLALENDTLRKFVIQMRPFPRKELEQLEAPTLLLIGDRDLFNTKTAIRIGRTFIPNIEAEVIHNSGHFLSIDQTEQVNNRMLEFMRKVDDGIAHNKKLAQEK